MFSFRYAVTTVNRVLSVMFNFRNGQFLKMRTKEREANMILKLNDCSVVLLNQIHCKDYLNAFYFHGNILSVMLPYLSYY